MIDIKKYDIGVLGVWSGCNYGSILTYYGLHEILKSLGFSVLMVSKINSSAADPEMADTHSIRFAKEHYDISKNYSLKNIFELNDLCDAFIVGSDQLWNYGISKSFGKAYYLDFADDNKQKISYATSFGHSVDFAPSEEQKKISSYMKRFDAISVREKDGVTLCKDIYGVEATHVVDPILLCGKNLYEELSKKSLLNEKSPYILTYILDPTPEKRAAILYISEYLGLRLINILDGLPWNFEKNKRALNLDGVIPYPSSEDFVYLYRDAQFVVTDSFHGTVFALLFNKLFVSIGNKHRGMSRFNSLFEIVGNNDRFTTDAKTIVGNKIFFNPVDYVKMNAVLEKERKKSFDWLKKALFKVNKTKVVATSKELGANLMCSGCGACVNLCPQNALILKPDELGYYRPALSPEKCISCGLCVKHCPALALPKNSNTKKPKLRAFIASDGELLHKSSSGGIFAVLAKQIFARGGVVVGAAWSEDFSVHHTMVEDEADLHRLQKSKYLQSYIGQDIFRKVRANLETGRYVLFSGCPCQVAGLSAFLGKDYPHLITVDLLCGNAPSALFFKKYLDGAFGKNNVKSYTFRHKQQGWNSDCLTLTLTLTNNTTLVRRGTAQDEYQSVYHNHTMCAPHCENCRFAALPRFGDITIGDFWGLKKRLPDIDTAKGVSSILSNSAKGENFLSEIEKMGVGIMREMPLEFLGGNGYAVKSHNYASKQRDIFYNAIKTMSFNDALKYIYITSESEDKISNADKSEFKDPLDYNTKFIHFIYDTNYFEEHYINGKTVLYVKSNSSLRGIHAALPLHSPLAKGEQYRIDLAFKINSTSSAINFHVKNVKDGNFQVILSHKINPTDRHFVSTSGVFVPNSGGYDSFMVGAFHLRGDDAHIAFDYVRITKLT